MVIVGQEHPHNAVNHTEFRIENTQEQHPHSGAGNDAGDHISGAGEFPVKGPSGKDQGEQHADSHVDGSLKEDPDHIV